MKTKTKSSWKKRWKEFWDNEFGCFACSRDECKHRYSRHIKQFIATEIEKAVEGERGRVKRQLDDIRSGWEYEDYREDVHYALDKVEKILKLKKK